MNNNYKKLICILLIVNILTIIIALMIGTEFINPFEVIGDPILTDIVLRLRLPRIISATVAGMTLAAGGLLIQVSMNNELADTTILGFQSGATLVALLVMLAFPSLYTVLPLLAFLGGLIVYFIVFYIASKTKGAVYLIVAGIAVSAVVRSLINLISMIFAQDLENTISWMNGSLSTVSIADAKLMVLYGIVFLIIAILISSKLDLLLMDDDFLKNLGIKPIKLRFTVSALAILLASISVSFIGIIGFVGLLAPHISRRLIDGKTKELMTVTILVGSLLVVGCDTLQRLIFPIYEIPVGTTLSFVGGIYLIYLLVRSFNVKV